MMPERADVVIVGGGVVGSSIALHLRERLPSARIVVVERDSTYARASSRLATGGVRQQYGSPVNVSLARHSIGFYARMDERLASIGHAGRIRFRQRGYLFLADASTEEAMERRFEALRAGGACVERWTRKEVRAHVPGLHCDDVPLALFGPEDGYLEPREVLVGMRALALASGATCVEGEVIAVGRLAGRVGGVTVRSASGTEHEIAAGAVVDAAGAFAARVAAFAGLDLPITPVRQHLFRLRVERPLPSRIPMIFDPDGTHWRLDDAPERPSEDRLVVGRSRPEEPAGENFACDDERLTREMLPTLARRYGVARVTGVAEQWAGLYEMTPDHNALIGEHPAAPGMLLAAGFSGHGLMMAPATGRAVAEMVADGHCASFDLAPLRPDRFERGEFFFDGALI